jgi:hypothetical protein
LWGVKGQIKRMEERHSLFWVGWVGKKIIFSVVDDSGIINIMGVRLGD